MFSRFQQFSGRTLKGFLHMLRVFFQLSKTYFAVADALGQSIFPVREAFRFGLMFINMGCGKFCGIGVAEGTAKRAGGSFAKFFPFLHKIYDAFGEAQGFLFHLKGTA